MAYVISAVSNITNERDYIKHQISDEYCGPTWRELHNSTQFNFIYEVEEYFEFWKQQIIGEGAESMIDVSTLAIFELGDNIEHLCKLA